MNATLPLTVCFALGFVLTLSAQEPDAVAFARKVAGEIDSGLAGLKSSEKHEEDENGYPLDCRVWDGGGTIRKLQTGEGGDHGSITTSFYYAETGDLVAAQRETTTETIDGKFVSKREDRFTFSEGKLIGWEDGAQAAVDPKSESFSQEETALIALQVRGLALFGFGPIEDAAKVVKVLKEGQSTGQFKGLEEGDYFYLQVAVGGEDQSYLILRASGLLEQIVEQPEAFVGKSVLISWQQAMVHIPQAGGEQEMLVVEDVELPK
jgi:hypothetical protein